MRNLRNTEMALAEALTMLSVIERGGSYKAFDYVDRLEKMKKFLGDEAAEALRVNLSFDLEECSAKISRR